MASVSISRSTAGLAGLFAVSGVVHLARPEVYEPLMPSWVPAHREVILGSGIAELACAVGLLHPRTRSVAGWGSTALLLAVYPGNIKMAADASRSRKTGLKVATLARLPLQVPMIRAALRAARGH